MDNKKLIKKLENASVICRDCGLKYGVYSVGCSSVWEGVCNVCDETKPVTETRDYAYLMTGIRKLLKEDIKEQSKEVAEYILTQEPPVTNHPITPPPELVEEWASMLEYHPDEKVFTEVARWGSDTELEACYTEVTFWGSNGMADKLRAARRPTPKPPETIEVDGFTYRLVQ
jgi:hypothetical protein